MGDIYFIFSYQFEDFLIQHKDNLESKVINIHNEKVKNIQLLKKKLEKMIQAVSKELDQMDRMLGKNVPKQNRIKTLHRIMEEVWSFFSEANCY